MAAPAGAVADHTLRHSFLFNKGVQLESIVPRMRVKGRVMTGRRALFVFMLCAAARPASAQTYTLRGTIVSPSDVFRDGSVAVNGAAIAQVNDTPAPNAIDVDGVIFPGLIDLHNHLTWNLFPRWKPNRLFANRYEWQETAEYAEMLSGPNAALNAGLGDPLNSYSCDMNRYGELKAIINGATSTVGGGSGECIRGLARNLDALSELTPNQKINAEPFRNLVFPFQPSTPCEEQAIRDLGKTVKDCSEHLNVPPKQGPATRPKPSTLNAVVAHVAEGADASARREFAMLESHGFLVPGLSIIHGVALQREHFLKMAQAGVGFIWSPRSNIELYGRTADIASAAAVRDGAIKGKTLTIAIAPDWSPTGSSGMLAELAYAERLRHAAPFDAFTEKDLVDMATVNPAKLAGLDSKIGRIAPGYASDLIVMRRRPWTHTAPPSDAQMRTLAYQALLMQTPADLKLVVIGGVPVFGEPALMGKLLSAAELQQTETIMVCGESRVINVKAGQYKGTPWSATEQRLTAALASFRIGLADFVECR
jgi:cytosine/adenosine deaminase-related metal-dependent hydrolase